MKENLLQLVSAWDQYAKINRLRPGTQKYAAAQHAFILGVKAGTPGGELPPIISVYVMSGRDISDIPGHMAEREARDADIDEHDEADIEPDHWAIDR
jgi:hypothetical protein